MDLYDEKGRGNKKKILYNKMPYENPGAVFGRRKKKTVKKRAKTAKTRRSKIAEKGKKKRTGKTRRKTTTRKNRKNKTVKSPEYHQSHFFNSFI